MAAYAATLLPRIQAAFEAHSDPVRAVAMAAYMRDQFPFTGIPSPRRVALQREVTKALPAPSSADELLVAAGALWALPEREYQYAAIDVLSRHGKLLPPESLPHLQRFVTTKSWWDTVDALASHVVGPLVLRNPGLRTEMDTWAENSNFWVVRTAILHQLRHKSATDADRLFRYCEAHAAGTEFFIRKAIGWALREYSKTDAAAVRQFVAEHDDTLSGLSKREALLWLNGGRNGLAPRR